MQPAHLTCPQCGSSEFETDQARGDTVCVKCGIVIEDNVIVNEVQFEDNGYGATHVVGQRITDEYSSRSLSGAGLMVNGKPSRLVTIENAKRKIKTVGNVLNLNNVCTEQALGFYKMCLNKRLTHGRKNSHVIAACVYMVCRLEFTPHILLDLSDVMQVNVYDLGKTYLKLTSLLHLNIPPIDPCIYIMRYAHRLGIKEKANEIQMTALRLVSRMKRDWMHHGRRPSGLCGAALLVSARLHGMHCSIKDVIKVVKVCETTIRKRLNEFGETPSSKLTLEEFLSIDLEAEEDPPCYKTARKKNKEINDTQDDKQDKNEVELKEELNLEIERLQKKIDAAIEKSKKKLKGPYAKYAKIDEFDPSTSFGSENPSDENELTRQIIDDTTVQTINEVLGSVDESSANLKLLKDDAFYLGQIDELRPTAEDLGMNGNISRQLEQTAADVIVEEGDQENPPDKGGELFYDDLDDDELDSYLLSQKEIQTKTNYWLKYHAEYLKEVEEKERKKQLEEELRKEKEAKGEISPKKKRKSRKRTHYEASSAGEAIEKMLLEKKISNKINYDVLRKITHENAKEEVKNDNDDFEYGLRTPKTESIFETRNTVQNSALKRLPSIRSQMNLNQSTNSVLNENHSTKFKSPSLKSKFSNLLSSRQQASSSSTKSQVVELSPTKELPIKDQELIKKQNLDVNDDLDEDEESDDDYCVEKERSQLSLAKLMGNNFEEHDSYDVENDYEYDNDDF